MKQQKTVLVSGASGNLGGAVVQEFLNLDYRVTGLVHRKQQEAAAAHPNCESRTLDLMDAAACREAVAAVVADYGSLDAAVLTAGGFAMGDVTDTDTAALQQQYELNFLTAYQLAQPVFQQMLTQGRGRLFLIGSRQGLDAKMGTGAVAYSLAKSLLFRLAEILNQTAKGTDVACAVVVPGTIDTPQNRKAMPDADISKWVSPEAIAKVISFYASADAAIVRDPVIKVYGKG